MTATQGDLADLSRYIFRAPRWYSSVSFAVFIAALTGLAVFDSRYLLENAWEGIFYIGLPTLAASVMTPMIDRKLGGQLTASRASLLALGCELLVIAILTAASIATALTPLGQRFVFDALLFSLAAIFALRLLIVMAVSRHRLLVAAIPAGIQTFAAAVLLFVYSGTMRYLEIGGPLARSYLSRPEVAPPELLVVLPGDFVLLGALCAFYGIAVWLFLVVLDRPWRRSLGVSALDFLQGFIGHIAEGSQELEDFFEQIGEEALVPVTVLAFRRPDGTEKARFVLPMIHPGPMGEIGGGNLPERIAESADGLGFPPHATAGHDFNLVTEREVETIMAAAEHAHDRIEYSDAASRGHRLEEGEATLTGQAFGKDALLTVTFSPSFADDVEYAVGLSARAEARASLEDVMLIDTHNCNNGLEGPNLGHVVPGGERSFDMIHGAERLGDRLAAAEQCPLKLGTAHDETEWDPAEGIGPLGVRVAVVEVDGHTTAYVLVDGNNMEPGLRERIVDSVEGVDLLEVLTSDTHTVNTVEAENQVGDAIPESELVALIDDLVTEALGNLEPVEAGMASEKAEVTVFGNDRTETLASTANAVISLGGALAAIFVLAVVALSFLLFILT